MARSGDCSYEQTGSIPVQVVCQLMFLIETKCDVSVVSELVDTVQFISNFEVAEFSLVHFVAQVATALAEATEALASMEPNPRNLFASYGRNINTLLICFRSLSNL